MFSDRLPGGLGDKKLLVVNYDDTAYILSKLSVSIKYSIFEVRFSRPHLLYIYPAELVASTRKMCNFAMLIGLHK